MDRNQLKEQLKIHEGIRTKPYKDSVGKLTIGVGHNLDDKPISTSAVEAILEDDIDDVVNDLNTHLSWWSSLSANRQLVLADMCFNLGIERLKGFKNTLAAMEQGKYEDAAKGMEQSLWAKQVGKRAVTLVKMMREG